MFGIQCIESNDELVLVTHDVSSSLPLLLDLRLAHEDTVDVFDADESIESCRTDL
jgi:hypothetical protein